MKTLYISLILLCVYSQTFAQIGINTENPEATLDVNGDMRIRQNPEVNEAEYVLSADNDGFVRQIDLSTLNLEPVKMEGATFVPGVSDNLTDTRTPTLDLWSIQEDTGVEGLKRYYFLGQNALITLPKNISVLGDATARVITFIVVKNDEFGGASLSRWNAIFQTKLYQENTNTFNGGNGGVELYENTFNGSDLTSASSPVSTESGSSFRRRVNLQGQSSIRDREINFYDFGGKWIMTVND